MKPKAWSASSDSQTIINMTENDHIRPTSGETSDQNFITGKFYFTESWRTSNRQFHDVTTV